MLTKKKKDEMMKKVDYDSSKKLNVKATEEDKIKMQRHFKSKTNTQRTPLKLCVKQLYF